MADFLGWRCQLPPTMWFLKFIYIAYFFVLSSLLTIPIGRSFILVPKCDKKALLFFLYFFHTWAGESRPCHPWQITFEDACNNEHQNTPFECLKLDSGLSADAESDVMGLCEERCKKMCLFRKRITCGRSKSQNRLGLKPKDTAQSDAKLRQPFFHTCICHILGQQCYLVENSGFVASHIQRESGYKVLEAVQDNCYNQNSSKHYFQKTWFRKKGH